MTAISSSEGQSCAAVIDLDNLTHRGFDKRHHPRAQAEIDILGMVRMLRSERGVTCGTVCRNRPFSLMAQAFWHSLGFETASAGRNCDDMAIAEARRWAASGVERLVLLTGDCDFAALVGALRAQGLVVELAAKSHTCSRRLRAAVDSFTPVDPFLRPPRSQMFH